MGKCEKVYWTTATDISFQRYIEGRKGDTSFRKDSLDGLIGEPLLPERFSLLDIGAGPGLFAHIIDNNPLYKNRIDYFGVEQSTEAVGFAKSRLPEEYVFFHQDVVKDGLPDGYYDTVLINDVLEHIPHYAPLLEDVFKRKPKVCIINSFAVVMGLQEDFIKISEVHNCHMNSYSFSKFYNFIKEITDCYIRICSYGHRFCPGNDFFPEKEVISWFLRTGSGEVRSDAREETLRIGK